VGRGWDWSRRVTRWAGKRTTVLTCGDGPGFSEIALGEGHVPVLDASDVRMLGHGLSLLAAGGRKPLLDQGCLVRLGLAGQQGKGERN
jgi:hypothetical protein